MVFSRATDWFFTHKYSPDLRFEANPMVSIFKFHWPEFILFSLVLLFSISFCLYYDLFSKRTIYPQNKNLPFSEFASIHWFGRKRHPISFLLAFAKDWDLRVKFLGFAGSRLLILISVIASISWVGLAESSSFEMFYNLVFPFFPYGIIVFGAVFLLYYFLRREYQVYKYATS